ncbi:hypothetical protein HG619_03405 [Pseudomonas syringae]|nr:hypothetical protein [Pseudomonas syringae]
MIAPPARPFPVVAVVGAPFPNSPCSASAGYFPEEESARHCSTIYLNSPDSGLVAR